MALASAGSDQPALVAATLAAEEYARAVHNSAYSLRGLQEDPALSLAQRIQAVLRRAQVTGCRGGGVGGHFLWGGGLFGASGFKGWRSE